MSKGGEPSRIETFLYDADGNRTEDENIAVRGRDRGTRCSGARPREAPARWS